MSSSHWLRGDITQWHVQQISPEDHLSVKDLCNLVQDALLYSRSWVYPSEGSAVGVTNYAVRDGVVRPTRTPAVAFGTDWFEGVLNEASSNGIVALLLAQGRPVVAFRPEAIESASARLIRRFGLVVFLLSPLLFLRLNLTTQFFYGMRNLLLRRKRQTA